MNHKHPFVTGNTYHIYNRGVARSDIFKSEHDFNRFLMLMYTQNTSDTIQLSRILDGSENEYNDVFGIVKNDNLVSIGPWCLMTNHFHIIIRQEIDGGVSKFLQKLSNGYTMYVNKKYARTGALFGGNFKSKLVDSEEYLRYVYQYVHMNPLDVVSDDWEDRFLEKRILTEQQTVDLLKYPYSSYVDFMDSNRVESKIINLQEFEGFFQPM